MPKALSLIEPSRHSTPMDRGCRVVITDSAGVRLGGRRGVIFGAGETRTKKRVLLDGNKHPITFHVRFLEVERVKQLEHP